MRRFKYGFLLASLVLAGTVQAQEQWSEDMGHLDDLNSKTTATFKTTRVATGHSVEQCKAGVLDFRVNHRFGRISDGFSSFFGLDDAVTRIGADYGITDYLMVGAGRSTLNKEYDAFAKVKILGQAKKRSPVTLNYLAGVYVVAEKYPVNDVPFINRFSYAHQLLVARKITDKLSIQLMPTFMHFNRTALPSETNNMFSMGVAGRYKLGKRLALTAEYYYTPESMKRAGNVNPLTIGLDIETGGHVFQVFVSNARGLSERSLFTNTVSQWQEGQIHFGFNISRVFSLY